MIQRSALQNEVMTRHARPGGDGDLIGDSVVARQQVFAAPTVEAEGRGLAAPSEDRARIAQPDIAKDARHNVDAIDGAKQGGGRLERFLIAHQQLHPLRAGPGQSGRQRRHLLLSRNEIVLPELGMAGKSHPEGAVRGPFSGNRAGHAAGLTSKPRTSQG